jgi:adenosine/AMP kinase
MEIIAVRIHRPEGMEDLNIILGQAHFIKTVDDLHEALVSAVPGAKFGLAFCEASGPCLVRSSGTDERLVEAAEENALALSAGHIFLIILGEGFWPLNFLTRIRAVPEVCRIFCATANPVEVILAQTDQGRGILGVVDGFSSKGIESDQDAEERRSFLRLIGYRL